MGILSEDILTTQLLPYVQKPSRYTGGEWPGVKAAASEVDLRFCLAFPDVYEVGMSHLGLRILEGILQQMPGVEVDRVYSPWFDMEARLRELALPLFSIGRRRFLSTFEIIGFTLQYELAYTNILQMLKLGGIPLESSQRSAKDPLIVGGGPCAFNPEPLAPFFDCFVLGEGEEVLAELVACFRQWRAAGEERQGLWRRLAQIPGVYVPALYDVSYNEDGTLRAITPQPGVPATVSKRVLTRLAEAPFPEEWRVPSTEIIHDRLMLEIMRGCSRGCRFCQAGILYRPRRERRLPEIVALADRLLRQSGYEEVSLASLSSSDYTRIAELIEQLIARYEHEGIGVSLPSLRVDSFAVELAEAIQRVRKTGLTFAPEAGTQRLRDVINKNVTETELLNTASAAFKAGWTSLKLYFMIGLPTESKEDLEGIARLAKAVMAQGRQTLGPKEQRRLKLTLGVSSFVPKAHTPFQWDGQAEIVALREKFAYLRQLLAGQRQISLAGQEPQMSFIEAVLARGDRRLAPVLVEVVARGGRFDSWSEGFDFARWQAAFAKYGLDPHFYANRQRPYTELLPWEHLQTGVSRQFLEQERERALRGKTTPDCVRQCGSCGVCPHFGIAPDLADRDQEHTT